MQPLRGNLAPLTLASKAPGNGLLNNLVAYWGLDEAGGANNGLDKHSNGLTLTQNGLPGSSTGLVYAGARTFNGSSQYFARSSETLITLGPTDHTVAAWLYLSSKSATIFALGKANASDGADWDYDINYLQTTDRMRWRIGDGALVAVSANNFGAVPTGQWLLVIGWHDTTAKKIYISVNNGTADEASYTGTRDTTTKQLSIGALSDLASNRWNGRIGPVMMWKSTAGNGGVLTAAQRTALYAAGSGLAYSAFTS